MYENRQKWPAKKEKMHTQLRELPSRYGVVAIVRMEKVRASQILSLRKRLRGDVEFVNIKGKVTKKALAGLDVPGIAEIAAQVKGQCMFIFTNMSPFKLNVLLARNKVMLAARGGDAASIDVTIPAKNTGIAPGPMLTEFKEANVPTKIDQGTIWITKDTLAARRGETISPKLAALLGKLDIKAVEAGVELAAALEAGLFYTREDLIVDVGAVREAIAAAHAEATSLSIEAAYVTPENAAAVLARASQAASSLASESGYLTPETATAVLARASAAARGLAAAAKGYSAS